MHKQKHGYIRDREYVADMNYRSSAYLSYTRTAANQSQRVTKLVPVVTAVSPVMAVMTAMAMTMAVATALLRGWDYDCLR